MSDAPLKIYGDSRSGNCYKIKLLCAELDLEYGWREVDILAGETRTEAFLAMNANGKIPLLSLPDGGFLAESNAILSYLADGTPLVGSDRFARAEVLQWMFFEQYSHEPFIATSRFIIRFQGMPESRRAELEAKRGGGLKALDVMNLHLAERPFFANERYSIADIALYAYTHVADEGGFDVAPYDNVVAWLDRVSRQPGFVPMYA